MSGQDAGDAPRGVGVGASSLEAGLPPCTLSSQHVFLALRIQKLPRLLVASSSGHLYIYNLDPQDGGDCVLIKTHR